MKTVVYVSNADSGSISVLTLDEDAGTLATLQTLELGGSIMPLALSPDRRLLFAARRSAPWAALSLRIDARDGTLALLGEGALPESMAYLSTDRSGRYLFSASYGGGLVAVNPIGADGLVAAAQQVVPIGAKAHAIRADAGNRFVFATSLGAGELLQFRFDAATGLLTPNEPPALGLRASSGPRLFELHPDGRTVFLLNELDASIDLLALDPKEGRLVLRQTVATLPPDFAGEPWAADLHLTPDARWLFASERRSSTIASLRVDAATGALALTGHSAVQAQPRGFHVSPSGRWLVVAGQRSHRVGLHAIDAERGTLALVQEHAVGQNPNWVEMLTLPSAT
jgi:6-phosphogluconolactonase